MKDETKSKIKFFAMAFFLFVAAYLSCYFWVQIFFEGLNYAQNPFLIEFAYSSYFENIFYSIFPKLIYIILASVITFYTLLIKNALDKNVCKGLNFLLDNFLYSSLILIILIFCKIYSDSFLFLLLLLFFIPMYILSVLRKFAKTLYKYFWFLIILLWVYILIVV